MTQDRGNSRPVLLRCRSCHALNRVPADKLSAHPICGKCKSPLHIPTSPVNVTTAAFDQVVSSWPEYILVEFWARWCGHCRAVEPVLNGLAASHAGLLLVAKIDIDTEPVLTSRFAVKATPTFILFKGHTQVARLDGTPEDTWQLNGWIDQFIR